jgi:CheY-like chemotaxis protein
MAASAKRILVIDDEPMMRDVLVQLLEADGYRVFAAANGREGLAQARTVQPDLIMLDVDMPEPNGFEVCIDLKCETATARVPVLFISAWLSMHNIEQMKAVGAAGFLSKPFSLMEMRRAIDSLLERPSFVSRGIKTGTGP